MGLNNLGLGFVFTARDLASAKMARLEHRFTSLDERVQGGAARMTGAFRQLGIGLSVFTAGAATTLTALSLANAAGPFEQGLAAAGAVTQATTEQLQRLRDAAIQAGIETQFSPEEAVAGLQSLATAGQTAEQATRTLIPVLDLAAGSLGQLGVAQSAEAVVGTLNAYGLAADEAAGVTDKLLRITQLTNFQTRDFEAGLSKAAATGAVFDQNLDDVLVTMGLLRNRNIDASSAATAFRESVRRVGAESRAQQAITGAGVKVFDQQSGHMRSIVDIMSDFAQATANMSDAERNRRVVTAFGARGLLAFNAVMGASFTTMRDGQQVTLRGTEAIAALRDQMTGAEGTAARFREQLLDTFEGQKTLLRGTLQTFAVVLGEPFAAVFKPIIRAVVETLNAILRAFQAIPAPIKRIFAGLVLAAGSFLMLVGGILAAKAAIALLVIGLKLLGITMGGILFTMLPVLLIVTVLGAVVAGFIVAFRRNIGGMADVVHRTFARVKLLFSGLKQLFEQGGFSGAVRQALNRAENLGLKRFLITIYQVTFRIGQAWEGLKEGFVRTLEEAQPVFEDLMDAFGELGQELGALFSGFTGGAASLPSSEFRSFGQAAGAAISGIVRLFAQLIAVLARITSGTIAGFRSMRVFMAPAFDVVVEALKELRAAWDALTGSTKEGTKATDASTRGWRSLGEFLGQVFGGIVTVLTLALAGAIKVLTVAIVVVHAVKDAFVAAGTWIGETAAKLVLWFTETLPNAIAGAIATAARFFLRIGIFLAEMKHSFLTVFRFIVEGIKRFLHPVIDVFTGIGRTIRRVFNEIVDFVIKLLRKVPDTLLPAGLEGLRRSPLSSEVHSTGSIATVGRTDTAMTRAIAAPSTMPAVAENAGLMGEIAQVQASMRSMVEARGQRQGDAPPLQVNVQVDGETIARASHNAERDMAARAFSKVPVY